MNGNRYRSSPPHPDRIHVASATLRRPQLPAALRGTTLPPAPPSLPNAFRCALHHSGSLQAPLLTHLSFDLFGSTLFISSTGCCGLSINNLISITQLHIPTSILKRGMPSAPTTYFPDRRRGRRPVKGQDCYTQYVKYTEGTHP